MLMQKLLSRLPFGRKLLKRKKVAAHNNNLKYVRKLKVVVEEGIYTTKELIGLRNILEETSIDLAALQSIDKCTKVSFYSTSSQDALEAVRKKYYHRETIDNCKIVDLWMVERPLNGWWSSTESIDYFIQFMMDMIVKSINLENPVNREDYIKGIGVVTGEEEEFINSLLCRLLLSDFLSLISLLMENINVETSD